MDTVSGRIFRKTLSRIIEQMAGQNEGDSLTLIYDESTSPVKKEFSRLSSLYEMDFIRIGPAEMPDPDSIRSDAVYVFTRSNIAFSKEIQGVVASGRKVISCSPCSMIELVNKVPCEMDLLQALTEKAAKALTRESEFTVVGADGSKLSGRIDNYDAMYAGFTLSGKDNFTIIPGGIIGIPIVPDSVNGELYVNGFLNDFGQIKSPCRVNVRHGEVSVDPAADVPGSFIENSGMKWFRPAELGIGTNPYSSTSSDTHESESAYGIIDVGFGENGHIGGPIHGDSHYDVTLMNSDLLIDGRKIVEKGQILV